MNKKVSSEDPINKKDLWDKLDSVSNIIAVVILSIVTLYTVHVIDKPKLKIKKEMIAIASDKLRLEQKQYLARNFSSKIVKVVLISKAVYHRLSMSAKTNKKSSQIIKKVKESGINVYNSPNVY